MLGGHEETPSKGILCWHIIEYVSNNCCIMMIDSYIHL